MCLGNISGDVSANNMIKTGLNGYVYKFFVDYIIDTSNFINIHKYLMEKYDIKQCLKLFKKTLIGLLTGVVSASSHTKCVLLSNQECEIQPTFISLHSNEYSQEFHYYAFTVTCVTVNCIRQMYWKL